MPSPSAITQEDRSLIRNIVLSDRVYIAFERDRKLISDSLKTPGPYLAVIDKAIVTLNEDLKTYRSEKKARGIKVTRQYTIDEIVHCEFLCRGYTDIFRMRNSYLAAEATELMHKYLDVPNNYSI